MGNIRNKKRIRAVVFICAATLGLVAVVNADAIIDNITGSIIAVTSDVKGTPSIIKGNESIEDITPAELYSYKPLELTIHSADLEPRVAIPIPLTDGYVNIALQGNKYRCRAYDAKAYDPNSKAVQFIVFIGKINPYGEANADGLSDVELSSVTEDEYYRYVSFSGKLDEVTGDYIIPTSDCKKEDLDKYAYIAYPITVVGEDYNKDVDGKIEIPDDLKPRILLRIPKDTVGLPDTPLPKNGGSIYHKPIDPNTYWTD